MPHHSLAHKKSLFGTGDGIHFLGANATSLVTNHFSTHLLEQVKHFYELNWNSFCLNYFKDNICVHKLRCKYKYHVNSPTCTCTLASCLKLHSKESGNNPWNLKPSLATLRKIKNHKKNTDKLEKTVHDFVKSIRNQSDYSI